MALALRAGASFTCATRRALTGCGSMTWMRTRRARSNRPWTTIPAWPRSPSPHRHRRHGGRCRFVQHGRRARCDLAAALPLPTGARAARVIRRATGETLSAADLSTPQPVQWARRDVMGRRCTGCTIRRPAAATPGTGLPPAIVRIHGGPTGQTKAEYNARGAVFHLARLCLPRRQLSGQHRLWQALHGRPARPVGGARRGGRRRRRAVPGRRRAGRRRSAGDHGRQRGRVYRAQVPGRSPRLFPGRALPVRREQHVYPGRRHAQVRAALPGLDAGAAARGQRHLSRALAHLSA